MLPIPDAGIMPQSVPTVAADSVMDSEGDAAAEWGAAGAAEVPELPQAAAVSASAPAAAAMTSAPVLLVLFLSGVGMRLLISGLRGASGARR